MGLLNIRMGVMGFRKALKNKIDKLVKACEASIFLFNSRVNSRFSA